MNLREHLESYAVDLTANFSSGILAQPEDQLKGPVSELLRFPLISKHRVHVRTETYASAGRPDIGVAVDGALTGYIELKAPGKGARPERFRDKRDRGQWVRFSALPNLIYTDGNEWALYRTGTRVGALIRLQGDVTTDGASAIGLEDADRLADLLIDFLSWQPIVPSSPKSLAALLAPLCRLVRSQVREALATPDSALALLAQDWRRVLFAESDDDTFADSYAQTLTYGLLLARLHGLKPVSTDAAAAILAEVHPLLSQAVRVLGDPQAQAEIGLGLEVLQRVVSEVDPDAVRSNDRDPWLYFYEDFLQAYDRDLRKNRGVYYTPLPVVQAQVRLVGDLLEHRLGKRLRYAAEGVVFLDPAVGTGAYPLAAFADGIDVTASELGKGAVVGQAARMAENFYGFEILVGPYTVATLRMSEAIADAVGPMGLRQRPRIFLTDTLESPYTDPPSQLSLSFRPLADERKRAQDVKAHVRIMVCMGNPPYDRQTPLLGERSAARKGGWVRYGDAGKEGAALLEDFIRPAKEGGASTHLKNIYNDYVYFWRWALWKVLETTSEPGVVSFITASSYLRGPGFVGMRQAMRAAFDEIWFIDLEGHPLAPRKTENIFDTVSHPVVIAIGVRYGGPRASLPARANYSKLSGGREAKLQALGALTKVEDLAWRECFDGWQQPFVPVQEGDYFDWPLLTDLFPWQHSGVQFKRTWPVGPTREVLDRRWAALLGETTAGRALLFRQTSARRIDSSYSVLDEPSRKLPALRGLAAGTPCPEPSRYGWRSFDRQWALADPRLVDRPRPALWLTSGPMQVYMVSLLTETLGTGPAAVVTHLVPDLHYFCNFNGSKHVIPLWRGADGHDANVTQGALEVLSTQYGRSVDASELFCYAYALLASPAYVDKFSDELTIPGPRVPITADSTLFARVSAAGAELVWLHTFGERTMGVEGRSWAVARGRSRCVGGIRPEETAYPEDFVYRDDNETLEVGEGRFAPVRREIWEYSVSGFQVVRSWLRYRMRSGAGRTSSTLDGIRPLIWGAELTTELLELLWVLEGTVDRLSSLASLLRDVISGDLLTQGQFPVPSAEERAAPALRGQGELPLQDLE